eukprot:UC1_evm1s887
MKWEAKEWVMQRWGGLVGAHETPAAGLYIKARDTAITLKLHWRAPSADTVFAASASAAAAAAASASIANSAAEGSLLSEAKVKKDKHESAQQESPKKSLGGRVGVWTLNVLDSADNQLARLKFPAIRAASHKSVPGTLAGGATDKLENGDENNAVAVAAASTAAGMDPVEAKAVAEFWAPGEACLVTSGSTPRVLAPSEMNECEDTVWSSLS